MNNSDFKYISDLVRNEAAIVIGADKEYLVEARMQSLPTREKLESVESLINTLRKNPSGELGGKVVHAMTTNETSFFRDIHPFESLKEYIFPDLLEQKSTQKKISIWCAASSTGQEPYSIIMQICEYFPQLLSWDLYFLATDLSADVLARAQEGVFNQFEVNRGLPASMLVKYFAQKGTSWQVRDEIRKRIEFRELNLVRPWPSMPRFDLIFIRNVLIYFDTDTKTEILRKLESQLNPQTGYIAFGAAENILNVTNQFVRVTFDRSTFYQSNAKTSKLKTR